MKVNEKKSILAFYISKYNDSALNELGYYDGITATMQDSQKESQKMKALPIII